MLGALRGWGDADDNGQVTVREAADYSREALAALPLGRSQTPELRGSEPNLVLATGREEGPRISRIRRELAGNTAAETGSIEVSVGGGDLAAKLLELEHLQTEEAARQSEMERIRLEVEVELQQELRQLQQEAETIWLKVKQIAERGGDSGREALSSFILKYQEAAVTIGDEHRTAQIPALSEAQAWLARYDQDSSEVLDASSESDQPKRSLLGSSGYEMVWVEPGEYLMGSLPSEEGHYPDERQHLVRLTVGFYAGKYEVTQELWTEVMGRNPSHFTSCGSTCPVENVSWCDAMLFANALSRRDGLAPVYQRLVSFSSTMSDTSCNMRAAGVKVDPIADGYRLLTEAEWEYAARGGESHVYPGSADLDILSWYTGNSGESIHPVGQKAPNAFGLYDMGGNVQEWCWDWYKQYKQAALEVSPMGPAVGAKRVFRGGSWSSQPINVRVSVRSSAEPSASHRGLGLRLARSSSN
jgi:formylglycine-generating enzyme required for sulfatase activity